jgi:hypothetical protein
VPKVALADTFDDWDSLLRAAAPHADKLDLRIYLDELEGLHRRLREIEARRAELQALRQQATQELEEVREAGKMTAAQIRTALKAIFGPRSESLVQFRIRPRRSRRS